MTNPQGLPGAGCWAPDVSRMMKRLRKHDPLDLSRTLGATAAAEQNSGRRRLLMATRLHVIATALDSGLSTQEKPEERPRRKTARKPRKSTPDIPAENAPHAQPESETSPNPTRKPRKKPTMSTLALEDAAAFLGSGIMDADTDPDQSDDMPPRAMDASADRDALSRPDRPSSTIDQMNIESRTEQAPRTPGPQAGMARDRSDQADPGSGFVTVPQEPVESAQALPEAVAHGNAFAAAGSRRRKGQVATIDLGAAAALLASDAIGGRQGDDDQDED
ncbi:hypothetical protein EV663_10571 [Rhodovulum bhavnagarense]|uniref:Uncharacterized protein n=1 Tax=Rhodovulum bhavnagarense TaxID=992286 RepID=A0A4R2RES8_9RHOB|nr:hypothetical protein [Rhodovulum bhavnagarense]TCP61353.1 hypothetical protein EV663_10571 [Rhodovulum bhavnagarense]